MHSMCRDDQGTANRQCRSNSVRDLVWMWLLDLREDSFLKRRKECATIAPNQSGSSKSARLSNRGIKRRRRATYQIAHTDNTR